MRSLYQFTLLPNYFEAFKHII